VNDGTRSPSRYTVIREPIVDAWQVVVARE
jgi:hypothetical protein